MTAIAIGARLFVAVIGLGVIFSWFARSIGCDPVPEFPACDQEPETE